MEIIYLTIGVVMVLTIITFFVLKALKVKANPFLIIAIVDIIVGLLVLGFAIYDFHTSVGEFAGIFGQLALIICEPVVGGILLIDIIVWVVKKKKFAKQSN